LFAIYLGPVDVDRVLADVRRMALKVDDLRRASLPFDGHWLGRQPGHRFLRIAANVFEAGFPEESADYLLRFERYFGHSPVYADVAVQVGVTLAEKGQHQQASELFQRAQRLKPDVAPIRFYLAQSLERLGRPQEALDDYRKVIELDPKSINGNFRLGLLLANFGKLPEALPHFQKTVELTPDWADARFKLAMALLHLSRPDEALVQFREAIRLEPKDPSTQIQLAWTLATHPDPRFRNGAEAIRWAESACQATKYAVPRALDALAAANAEMGQFEQATANAQRARELARTVEQDQLAKNIEARLRYYENKRPYRVNSALD
jgi:Flp pilus assembly protein TadD